MPKRKNGESPDSLLRLLWRQLRSPTPPPRCGLSGRVIVVFIQVMVVETDDGADEFSELDEIRRDDVDAALPGSLWSDPLHHAR